MEKTSDDQPSVGDGPFSKYVELEPKITIQKNVFGIEVDLFKLRRSLLSGTSVVGGKE